MTINQTSFTPVALIPVLATSQNSQVTTAAPLSQASSQVSITGDSASTSDAAKVVQVLQQLSQSNRAEFKSIAASVARQLNAAAANASDPDDATTLRNLATNFANAAQTGNFADLFPQQQGSAPAPTSGPGIQSSGRSYSSGPSSDTISSAFANALQRIEPGSAAPTIAISKN